MGPPLFLGFLKACRSGGPCNTAGANGWWRSDWFSLVFYVLDRSQSSVGQEKREKIWRKWGCDVAHNFIFLLVLLGALIAVPAGWREPLMVLTALGSPSRNTETNSRCGQRFYFWTAQRSRVALPRHFRNDDSSFGIHGTLRRHQLGLNSDLSFYWGTGLLSGMLE